MAGAASAQPHTPAAAMSTTSSTTNINSTTNSTNINSTNTRPTASASGPAIAPAQGDRSRLRGPVVLPRVPSPLAQEASFASVERGALHPTDEHTDAPCCSSAAQTGGGAGDGTGLHQTHRVARPSTDHERFRLPVADIGDFVGDVLHNLGNSADLSELFESFSNSSSNISAVSSQPRSADSPVVNRTLSSPGLLDSNKLSVKTSRSSLLDRVAAAATVSGPTPASASTTSTATINQHEESGSSISPTKSKSKLSSINSPTIDKPLARSTSVDSKEDREIEEIFRQIVSNEFELKKGSKQAKIQFAVRGQKTSTASIHHDNTPTSPTSATTPVANTVNTTVAPLFRSFSELTSPKSATFSESKVKSTLSSSSETIDVTEEEQHTTELIHNPPGFISSPIGEMKPNLLQGDGDTLSETFQKILPAWLLPPFVVNPRTMKLLLIVDDIYLSEVRFWEDINKAIVLYVKPMIHEADTRIAFEGIAEMYVMSSGFVKAVTSAMKDVTDNDIAYRIKCLVAETVTMMRQTYKKYCSRLCQYLYTSYKLLTASRKFRDFVSQAQLQSSTSLYQLCFMPFDRLLEWSNHISRLSEINGLDSINLKAEELKLFDKDMIRGRTNSMKLFQILIQVDKLPVDVFTAQGQILRVSEPADLLSVNRKGTITSRKRLRLFLLREHLIIVRPIAEGKVETDSSTKLDDVDIDALLDSSRTKGFKKNLRVMCWFPAQTLQIIRVDYIDGERGSSIMEIQELQQGKMKSSYIISCICERYREQWVDYWKRYSS